MTTRTLTTHELNRALLARQMLLAREDVTPIQAISRLVGLQAQVPRPPFIGLWTRVAGFKRADLIVPLRKKKVVRVTAMRATLHLMSAADYLRLRGPLQPALSRALRAVMGKQMDGLDAETLCAEGRAFFTEAPATFDAFRRHLAARHPETAVRAMTYFVRTHLPLVQTPTAGEWGFPGSSDFALADEWLGRDVSASPAPADPLVFRYLAAFGPASTADIQAWSGLPSLREVMERLRPSLVTFRDERRRELFDLPDAPRPPADVPAAARLLPEFDNLVLGHDDRTRVLTDAHRPKVVSKNLQVRATFLVDGFVAGAWRLERTRRGATLVLEAFERIPKPAKTALEAEALALLAFAEPEAPMHDVRWLT